jgi:hypothetical protein
MKDRLINKGLVTTILGAVVLVFLWSFNISRETNSR